MFTDYAKDINQSNLPTPIYSVLVSLSVCMTLSTFHIFSQQLSMFSLCSSGLISALLVLSFRSVSMQVTFSPDIIPSG